jgi:hypothetical protein
MQNETRFRMVERIDPERFRRFAEQAQLAADRRIAIYKHMAALRLDPSDAGRQASVPDNGSAAASEPKPGGGKPTAGTEAIHG